MKETRSSEIKKGLITNGLVMSDSFPVEFYENIYNIIVKSFGKHQFYEHYSGAWNALSYRYQASIQYGDDFINTLDVFGTTPNPLDRFTQEKLLFNFYSSVFSTFESTYYGLYSIGHFISPKHFPISSPKDQQRISLNSTKEAYLKAFPTDQIADLFDTIANNQQYIKIKEIRNVLSHRTAPGRRMFVGIDMRNTPITEWKLNNTPLDKKLILECVESLSQQINYILHKTIVFIEKNV